MSPRGAFQAAKKVALALHNLITSQYPRDEFHIIGFAAYAREPKAHELPLLQWDEYVLGTNMQRAMLLAESLLSKHDANKQIIMISDGEPTAHLLPNGQHYFSYPPTRETYRATYGAVRRCTRKGIAINTFMLDTSYYLKEFMDQIPASTADACSIRHRNGSENTYWSTTWRENGRSWRGASFRRMELELGTDKMRAWARDGVGWMVYNNPARRNAVSLERRVVALSPRKEPRSSAAGGSHKTRNTGQ